MGVGKSGMGLYHWVGISSWGKKIFLGIGFLRTVLRPESKHRTNLSADISINNQFIKKPLAYFPAASIGSQTAHKIEPSTMKINNYTSVRV